MGLVRVRPQRVEHSDGWAVEGAGRHRMAYEQAGRRATIGVEHGAGSTLLQVESLAWDEDGEQTPVAPDERDVVLDRIVEGARALTDHRVDRSDQADPDVGTTS